MNVQINPTSDGDAKHKSKIRKKLQSDNGLGIIAKTIICIVILDAIIWGYFTFVKNVTVIEGIRGWQASIHEFIGVEDEQPEVRKRTIVINIPTPPLPKVAPVYTAPERHQYNVSSLPKTEISTKDEIQNIEAKMEMAGNHDETLYSWKDEAGKIHYSNTGFPAGNIERLWARRKTK